MSEPFYILTCTREFYDTVPRKITSEPKYYKYVEDANYDAGKIVKQLLGDGLADEFGVWEEISECGDMPFVQTTKQQTVQGRVDFTVTVQKGTLCEDVQDVVFQPATSMNLDNPNEQKQSSQPVFPTFLTPEDPIPPTDLRQLLDFNSQPTFATMNLQESTFITHNTPQLGDFSFESAFPTFAPLETTFTSPNVHHSPDFGFQSPFPAASTFETAFEAPYKSPSPYFGPGPILAAFPTADPSPSLNRDPALPTFLASDLTPQLPAHDLYVPIPDNPFSPPTPTAEWLLSQPLALSPPQSQPTLISEASLTATSVSDFPYSEDSGSETETGESETSAAEVGGPETSVTEVGDSEMSAVEADDDDTATRGANAWNDTVTTPTNALEESITVDTVEGDDMCFRCHAGCNVCQPSGRSPSPSQQILSEVSSLSSASQTGNLLTQ